mgnify:CR=1 FL=1
MKRKLSAKEYTYVASMLFGLFFGAGNLIFPVHLGQMAGSNVWQAILGLLITGTQVRILPGRSAKKSAAAKNATEKSSRYSVLLPFCGSTCSSPTVNDVVAQRGMAKNGPIVR